MTEIPVFPAGQAGSPPDLEPGDWAGLFGRLHEVIGKLASRVPDPLHERRDRSQKIWSVRIDPVPIPIVAGSGILDQPAFFSPNLGEYWDVHTISATGFTAGTVTAWINLPQLAASALQGALRFSATSAGFANYGKMQLHLRPSDRLVFLATGITGNPIVSVDATRVSEDYWSTYVL